MVRLKGFLVYNPELRAPPGCLIFYPSTKQVVAVSDSPISDVVMSKYKLGISYNKKNELGETVTLKGSSEDLSKFLEVAAEFFALAHFKTKLCDITPPLRGEIYLDPEYNILPQKVDGCKILSLRVNTNV